MMTHPLTNLMLVAALAGSDVPHACETPIQLAIEGSKVVAHFTVGDSSLTDGDVRSTRVSNGD